MKRIGVIVGSTRPKRISKAIAAWVLAIAQDGSALTYELVDLADAALPILDEPEMAATGIYAHDHTKRWSALIAGFDGFVFVAPQYNWGYPAVLKNALDYLYAEWSGKPVGLVSFGTRGGVRCIDQLKTVVTGLHMRNTATNPALNMREHMFSEPGTFIDIARDLEEFAPAVRAMNAELIDLLDQPADAPE
jgi:NAD(P)H-dependent FMN reductase